MKSKKKVLGLVICAVLLVVGSVMGTMAWLTSNTETVTNTFSVGKVTITLDEADTDEYGKVITGAEPVMGNEYKLIPGHEYAKIPVVHVQKNSEPSYVFVKVTNDISGLEASKTIAEQMSELGWKPVTGAAGVYYYDGIHANMSIVDAREAAIDLVVFEKFTLKTDANVASVDNTKSITIDAYAIQADGFTSAQNAWENAPTTW